MMGRVRQVVASLAGVGVLVASLVAGTAPAASAAGCSVTNAVTGVRFTSLQSAVNAASPGDTLTVVGTCTGNVTVDRRLTLRGSGSSPALRGNGGRPLTITGGPVTIDRLRIVDGVATSCLGAPGQACGGGLATTVRVNLKRSVVADNVVSGTLGAFGGGIAVLDGGSLVATGSTIRDNTTTATSSDPGAQALGGGISGFGSVKLTRTTLDGNVASGSVARGGGVRAEDALTLVDSIVTDNQALADGSAEGGGVSATASGVHLARITRSTVARNKALASNATVSTARGGGVAVEEAAIANSTLSGNTVQALGLAVGGASGGGVAIEGGSIVASTVAGNSATSGGGASLGVQVEMGTTIVAGNTATSASPDCLSVLGTSTLGRNLVGDGTGCGAFSHGVAGDKVGSAASPIAPKLAPLADNGGSTPTRALKAGSPALDAAGGKPCSTTTDQRGVKRPQGAKCDIGAFEKG